MVVARSYLSDANKQSLIEILDSKLAREMIEAFKNGVSAKSFRQLRLK